MLWISTTYIHILMCKVTKRNYKTKPVLKEIRLIDNDFKHGFKVFCDVLK